LPFARAAADNPTMLESPKYTRRWYQFNLRTLMIAVTLLAVPMGYVGWQLKIVRARYKFRDHPPGASG
jgi:hypothetical protein